MRTNVSICSTKCAAVLVLAAVVALVTVYKISVPYGAAFTPTQTQQHPAETNPALLSKQSQQTEIPRRPTVHLRKSGPPLASRSRNEPTSTQLRRHSAEANRQVLMREERPLCTFAVLKQYISSSDFYPGQGSWTKSPHGGLNHFEPQICRFNYSYDDLPKKYVALCLSKKNIKNILLAGDSQAVRYFDHLHSYLKAEAGFFCTFLQNPIQNKARTLMCTYKNPSNPNQLTVHLQLESFVMNYHGVFYDKTNSLGTLQDYYFRVYLKKNFPDVLILFGNHHDFRDFKMQRNKADINNLVELLGETVPSTVPLIWLPTTEEFEAYRPDMWKNKTYDDGQYNSHQKIRLVNELWFNATKPLMLRRHSRFLPFLDMQSVSNGVLQELNLDGVHFKPLWYKMILSYLLQTICESDLVDLLF